MSATPQPQLPRDHGFHPLRVRRVERETPDSCSLVLDVPAELREAFSYRAGQFVTFRLPVDGEQQLRSYSMSSSPECDEEFQVTVKRVPGGLVSTWLTEQLEAGAVLDTTCPAGVFCLTPREGKVIAFAGGSGITPVFSLVKSTLAATDRSTRVLYANRDRESVIFAAALDRLQASQPDRLQVVHHLDEDAGLLGTDAVSSFVGSDQDAEFFICGPGPFMDLVESTLLGLGVAPAQIHIERFLPREPVSDEADPPSPAGALTDGCAVTIELNGRTATTQHRPGTTVLQTARQAGLTPPFSCEAGDCATCMAKLIEGSATMFANNALTDDEVTDGWILTCQAVPQPPGVHVVYGYDD